EFRNETDVDLAQVLAENDLPDRFEYAERTYPTIGTEWPVELNVEDAGSLDGQALREAIGERTLQEIIDAFVDLIETVHPAVVDADTPTQ
ncbi:MAG: hypothetical protein ABEI77_04070, partial [Halorientalis sp.]